MTEKSYDQQFPVGYASFSVQESISISFGDFSVRKSGLVAARAHIRIANTNRNNNYLSKDWEWCEVGEFRTFDDAMIACMKFANKKLHFKASKHPTMYTAKTHGMARIGKRIRTERLAANERRRAKLQAKRLQTA